MGVVVLGSPVGMSGYLLRAHLTLMRELALGCPSTCPLCPWKAPAALSVASLLCQTWASWPAGRGAAGTDSWRHAGRGQGCVSPLRKPI